MTPAIAQPPCPYCAGYHSGKCHLVKAIEYHPNGTIKRVEFMTVTDFAAPILTTPATTGSSANPMWPPYRIT